ncbi:MAG: hypothetical protein NT147_03080 [Candidatus Aminicenantes bacterium]|nr:hypothetical protein [Candidatus Aminicenantes bacterium]
MSHLYWIIGLLLVIALLLVLFIDYMDTYGPGRDIFGRPKK